MTVVAKQPLSTTAIKIAAVGEAYQDFPTVIGSYPIPGATDAKILSGVVAVVVGGVVVVIVVAVVVVIFVVGGGVLTLFA